MSYVLVLVAANMYLLLHCSSFLTAGQETPRKKGNEAAADAWRGSSFRQTLGMVVKSRESELVKC